MKDLIDDIRRRALIDASMMTHYEWTTIVRSFYQRILRHHPALARHFAQVNIEYQVQKLIVVLSNIARDLPDKSVLDRVLFQLGVAHVARGIPRAEFTEFITLLASVLSAKASLVNPDEAYVVWHQELSTIAATMLLTAP